MKEQNGRILSDYEHILINEDMYIGSISNETHNVLVSGKFEQRTYIPGLVKIIDEIIDNSIDEAIRTDFKFANKIDIVIDDQENKITVKDNGRGIPQYNVDTPEGNSIPFPMACYTRARSGGNFEADRKGIGKNGVGSVLTNLYSTWFQATTCDGKNTVIVHCTQNAEYQDYSTKKGGIQGTTVEFTPDLIDKFGIFHIDDTVIEVVKSRIEVLSVLFPDIKFTFNGKRVESKFKKFADMFGEHVAIEGDNYSFFISNSDEFRQMSYVNGVHTKQGGNHVEYIINELCDTLTPMIKRKFGVEITKARIKENVFLFLSIRNFVGSKFDGQTKERLSNSNGQIKDHCGVDFKALARKIISNENVIMPIVESALAKKEAVEKALATKAQKKALDSNVPKHVEANKYGKKGFNTTLFLTEGDSAIGFFTASRNKDTQGGFPLRGKLLNVMDVDKSKVLKTKEIMEIISILGMTLDDTKELKANEYYTDGKMIVSDNDEVLVNGSWIQSKEVYSSKSFDLMVSFTKENEKEYRNQTNVRRNTISNYDQVAILVDADPDGRGHISPLIVNLFYKYWPHFIKQNRLLIYRTPEYISTNGKESVWNYDTESFNNYTFKGKGWVHEHIKGLGQMKKEDYKKSIQDPYFEIVYIDDEADNSLNMFFGKEADLRKDWLDDGE